ncbi:hypothetical protein [Williamsia sp. CHRR-6]|uniref:hypothetical protein n=1 Tax=Williamsia sp. CHRR-6 TaxID=2835871 RepID=UPI001BDAE992|nr:hypothetical protein [Williamsia sp. CHRR-6]MBT0565590.1 hypothetical protein [Williamsia sp. CHRR-6]
MGSAIALTLGGAVACVVLMLAADTGRRGEATNASIGYSVPEHVKIDPELRKRANQILFRHCATAAVITGLIAVLGAPYALGLIDADISTAELVIAAGMAGVAAFIALLGLERIKQL